jgi:hypothetical protein
MFWCSDWLITIFIFSRIQEEIADYIPSLDQGLAVLTNSTLQRIYLNNVDINMLSMF